MLLSVCICKKITKVEQSVTFITYISIKLFILLTNLLLYIYTLYTAENNPTYT
jgi:hypothetical protein